MDLPLELQTETMVEAMRKFERPRLGALAPYFPFEPSPGPGDTVTYDVQEYQNYVLVPTDRSAGAEPGEGPLRTKVSVAGLAFKHAVPLNSAAIADERAVGSMTQTDRQAYVADRLVQLRNRFLETWDFYRAQWLTAGGLTTSANVVPGASDGNIYIRAKGMAKTTALAVDLGFLATHVLGSVAASWATNTTDIIADLDTARELCVTDGGADANLVLLNHHTMQYLWDNNLVMASEWAKAELARTGQLTDFRGYNFQVINDSVTVTADRFNIGANARQKLIPNNCVVLMPTSNADGGRAYYECECVDPRASLLKGLGVYTDVEPKTPQNAELSAEHTGAPVIKNTDSMVVFKDVTDTTP